MALQPDELGPRPPVVVKGRDSVPVKQPPLRDPPAAVVLSRLEGAVVPVIERRYGSGKRIYAEGDPDGGLRFVLSGAVRVYKRFGRGG